MFESKNTTSPLKAGQAVFTETSEGNPTPLIGAVPPDMVSPHAISTAHIVRSRGSPKLKCIKRNTAAASTSSCLHNYHRQRPRSNTVSHVGLQSSIKTSTQPTLQAMDISSKSVRTVDELGDCLPKPQFHQNYHPISPLTSMEEGEDTSLHMCYM